jgi:hypothetical protein
VSRVQAIEGGGFQVAFERQGDRYGHTVSLVQEGRAVTLVVSLEGSADERWPASPPLQQLHVEVRPGGVQVALLVGMAGTSHWSLSCALDPAIGEVSVEAACRVRDTPQWLGSSYRLAEGTRALQCAEGVRLQSLAGGCRIEAESVVCPTDGRLEFPLSIEAVDGPSTLQWRYRFRRLESSAEAD